MSDNEPVVITGEENIRLARLVTIRSGLRLEVHGLRRSRGRSMRAIANHEMGTSIRTARDTYAAYNKWLASRYGVQDRPLKEDT